MRNIIVIFILFTFVIISGTACDKNPSVSDYDYNKEINVVGYLWGNKTLTEEHAIHITYTQPVDVGYDLNAAAIQDIDVMLVDQSNDKTTFLYDTDEKPGYYFNDTLLIKPNTTYDLIIKKENNVLVSATTTVPLELEMDTELKPGEVKVTQYSNLGYRFPVILNSEDLDQILVVDMLCNEPYQNAEYIYPFSDDHKYPDDQEEYDQGENSEPRHIFAFMRLRDSISDKPEFKDQVAVYWYGSMAVFYGSYTLKIMVVDENYHRYLYEVYPEENGGINGGIGVFGSVVGDKYEFQITK